LGDLRAEAKNDELGWYNLMIKYDHNSSWHFVRRYSHLFVEQF
jgi:hypothetical protein